MSQTCSLAGRWLQRLLARLLRILSTGPCGTPAGHRPEAKALCRAWPRRDDGILPGDLLPTFRSECHLLSNEARAGRFRESHQKSGLKLVQSKGFRARKPDLGPLLSIIRHTKYYHVANSYQFILQPLRRCIEGYCLVGLGYCRRTALPSFPA